MDQIQEPGGLREEGIFQLMCRRDPVARTQYAYRSIEVVECHLSDVCRQIVQEGSPGGGFTGHNDLSGFLYRRNHLLIVEGHQRAGIDHLGAETIFFFEFFCCLQSWVEGMSDGEEGDVFSLFLHIGFSQRYLVIACGYTSFMKLFTHIINALAFEENDRVGTLQCRVHQSFGIVGCNREADLDAGNMCHQRGPVL